MHLGDPLPLVEMMFQQFEKPELRGSDITCYTHDNLVFHEKLKAVSKEFDLSIAAKIAKLILEQYDAH